MKKVFKQEDGAWELLSSNKRLQFKANHQVLWMYVHVCACRSTGGNKVYSKNNRILHKAMCGTTPQHAWAFMYGAWRRAWCTVCSIYCPLSVWAGCRLTLSSDPTLWMIMPTTRTGAKSATEQHLTSEHGMKDVWLTFSNGYKINGSGIYTVCLSFTKRLLVIFSWFILANVRINFLFPYFYISFVVFPDLEMKLTAPCRHKDQSN